MQEKSIEKDEEILNNIKAYMQENIDKGYHKFVYNYLGYDEKCVDVINAIEHILSDYKRVLKENEELEEINNELESEKNEAIRRYNFETISIQKVKDKIEELNQYYKKEIYPSLYQWCDITITEHYDEMIELLQELLGDK